MFDDTRGGGGGGDDGGWGGGSGRFGFFGFNGRPMHYILDGHTPRPAPFMVWARWFEDFSQRRVAVTRFRGLMISTVFLGLDAAFEGPPRLFETGLFIGLGKRSWMSDCWRASTWDEAVAFHEVTCAIAHTARSGRALARETSDTRRRIREAFRYEKADDQG